MISEIPVLGSGLGWRRELADPILRARDRIDVVELLVDQFLDGDRLGEARRVCDVIPTVPHGIGLSIGSADGIDSEYLEAIKRVADLCTAPYYSEHLCHTRAAGVDIGHLAPLRFTEDVLAATIRNVHHVQEVLDRPLVLENVTYHFDIPAADMSQAEFFSEVVGATGCGILLDLTNAYTNAANHGYCAGDFVGSLPQDSVVQVHLAGGTWDHGILIDSHSAPVEEPVWALLRELAERITIRTCILEHDANFPADTGPLLAQVERARKIMESSCVA